MGGIRWRGFGGFLSLGPSMSCRLAIPLSSLSTLPISAYIAITAFSLPSPYLNLSLCLQCLGIRASHHPGRESLLLPSTLFSSMFPSIPIRISLTDCLTPPVNPVGKQSDKFLIHYISEETIIFQLNYISFQNIHCEFQTTSASDAR